MKRPLFSCVVPVKGPRPYFEAALESLRSQGMGDDLEIIVQDGSEELFECSEISTDRRSLCAAKSLEWCSIDRLKDAGVDIRWEREPDQGQSDALNKGFAKAKGEWLFWLNADDVLLPGALKRLVRLIDCSACSIEWIAGNMMYIDAEGKVIDCHWDRGWKCAFKGLPVQVYGPSSFFRRELFEECGGLDTSLRVCMDVDLWMKFREHGHWFRRLPQYVWGFRRHAGSLTKSWEKSPEEQARQKAEIARVQARHGVKVTWWRRLRARLIRLLDGSYLKGVWDTGRVRGRKV